MPEKRLNQVEPEAVSTLRELVDNLNRIEDDFRADAKRQQRFRLWVFVVGAFVLLGLGILGYTAAGTRQLVNYVADCQNPSGECARKSNERVGGIIARLNENQFNASIYLGECARQYPDLQGEAYKRALRACVAAKRTEGATQAPR